MSEHDEDSEESQQMQVDQEALDAENAAKAASLKEAGNNFYKQGDYDRAIDHYRAAIELAPNEAAYYGNLAAACVMLKRYNKALASSLKAIELDPTFVKAYLRAGHCYTQQGKWIRAKQMYDKALELEPNNSTIAQNASLASGVRTLIEAGRAAYDSKQYYVALKKASEAREMADRAQPAALLQCEALLALGDVEKCSTLAGDFLRDDDQYVPLLLVRSKALAATGDLNQVQRGVCAALMSSNQQAVKHLQKAHQLDPDNKSIIALFKRLKKIDTLKQAGNAAFSASQHETAIQKYTAALEQCSESSSSSSTSETDYAKVRSPLYANRAASHLALRQYERAIADCTSALEIEPEYVKALLRRAKAHTGAGNYQDAVYDYDKAFKLDQTRSTKQLLEQAKQDLKQSKRKDYYKLLGVTRSATAAEIKKGYRKEALKNHPDKASAEDRAAAEQRFKEIGEAYGVLSDANKKRKYDSGMDLEDIEQGGMGGGHHHQAADIFAQMFGGSRGGGFGGHGFHSRGYGGGGGGFYDDY